MNTPRPFERVLVANRGEVAVRIIRALADLGIAAVAVHSRDDAHLAHVRLAEEAVQLDAVGPAAYTDREAVLAAAVSTGATAIHPGYGFLSEDAAFARACVEAGLTFIGPSPESLSLFGDKAAARALADECGVPVPRGSLEAVDLEWTRRFLAGLEPGTSLMLKATAGGGGRGMREVHDPLDLDAAWKECVAEAATAFGDDSIVVEELLRPVRHVEVQLLGDGEQVSHLGVRECSLQRRHQKVMEFAPAIGLDPQMQDQMQEAAVRMGRRVGYRGLGTFEFLVTEDGFHFMEANPRLQVEHTVTEEVTGLDLVAISIQLAAGATLAELGLEQDSVPAARGVAIQARVNAEVIDPEGRLRPSTGVLEDYAPPQGPGVRVDGYAAHGAQISGLYDTLLAKVICHGPDVHAATSRLRRALEQFEVRGVRTNIAILRDLLDREEVLTGRASTQFLDQVLPEILASLPQESDPVAPTDGDPAAVLAPSHGVVVEVLAEPGTPVTEGTAVMVLEAMKMEQLVAAPHAGYVEDVLVAVGDVVEEHQALALVEPAEVGDLVDRQEEAEDFDAIRPSLQRLLDRRAALADEARPEAVARRHAQGKRTGLENVLSLCEPDTFVEYGDLVVAAQHSTRSLDDLVARTPRDGIVTGIGEVNGRPSVVMAYDYTVLAGTQGYWGHKKKDRMLRLAAERELPVVLFAEGGGGRAGDTDPIEISALDTPTFGLLGKLSGKVPLIGVTSGYCFAGNAVLLGSCDVVIATRDSCIGIGGPAMVEGAGLGSLTPEQIGALDIHVASGAVDLVVDTEEDAVRAARKYLSYFQGPGQDWSCADQRALRTVVPENRMRVYDIRRAIKLMADTDSVLELRPDFGQTMITSLARIEGRPVGILANNPAHLAGAIDSPGADKAARFMQLCEAYGLPILSLCDTPGIMVGPEAERTGLVRHASRTIVIGANLTVPLVTLVLRKAYGIGANVMSGGDFRAPFAIASWPTGEFGAMGVEGAIQLSHREQLSEIEDAEERQRFVKDLASKTYDASRAIELATAWELDTVIDPAETRQWISRLLTAAEPDPQPRGTRGRAAFIDTW